MNQDGMPMRFQAWDKVSKEMLSWSYLKQLMIVETHENIFTNEDRIILQAIGATSSDDPPQELYLGDLIEVEIDKSKEGKTVGLIVWDNFAVKVRLPKNEYVRFSWLRFSTIKRLGSRYTEEGKKILKKVGLEKS